MSTRIYYIKLILLVIKLSEKKFIVQKVHVACQFRIADISVFSNLRNNELCELFVSDYNLASNKVTLALFTSYDITERGLIPLVLCIPSTLYVGPHGGPILQDAPTDSNQGGFHGALPDKIPTGALLY